MLMFGLAPGARRDATAELQRGGGPGARAKPPTRPRQTHGALRITEYDTASDQRRGAVSQRETAPSVQDGAGQVGFSGVMPVPAYNLGSSDRTVSDSPAFTACQAIAAA